MKRYEIRDEPYDATEYVNILDPTDRMDSMEDVYNADEADAVIAELEARILELERPLVLQSMKSNLEALIESTKKGFE